MDWLIGGGEMGKLIRSIDWSKTPLGAIASWPQSLRTTVSLCLASNFPISISWGPNYIQIYNDGYWPICGKKHPHSMGQDFRECWASAWPAIGEAFNRACEGEASYLENQRIFLDRNGYMEETFFTFSFSPIRDETGGVGGLFHPVIELTQQTLAERRLQVLRDLSDQTTDTKTVSAAIAAVAQTLAQHDLDLPFVLIYLVDSDAKQARLVESVGLPKDTITSPTLVNLDAASLTMWPLADVVRSPHSLQVDGLQDRWGELSCGPYPESPQTALVLPIRLPGAEHPMVLLVAGVSSRRPLDQPYRQFYKMLGDAVTNGLSKARAYEAESKRAEALAEIDRAKTVFFSNVSHEFRTPLTLMLAPLEDALSDTEAPLPPSQRDRMEIVQRNGLRLLKLVNTLLDFSRIEAGRIQAVYQPTDLSKWTAELASTFRSLIERAGLSLVVECAPLSAPVYVDREMWEKIVFNLLSNAFKFTFAGQITVRLQDVADRIELTVADTGIGISSNEIPHLFERFHRVKEAQGRSFEGSGIGLSLVQELVKLHGGTVHITSELGQGSCFRVVIPTGFAHLPSEHIGTSRTLASTAMGASAYIEEAWRWLPIGRDGEEILSFAPSASSASSAPSTPSTPCARILLVDDNADMRDYAKRLLEQRYQVQAVADGIEAIAAVSQHIPDLVLTDVMMPRLDGFGLLRELRSNPQTRELPIILLSARAGEESRIEGLAAGADDYLIKPFSTRELLIRVEAALKLAQIRREAAIRGRAGEAVTKCKLNSLV
ncbi:response regulator [Tolypothrix sp. FACHB-123]|uniref:hybrid sensor histidine kinase/response regulator n=1 Tax=Tolypothrix sp. FACHB-123 TaxID=2692868 RepID=UPI0016867C80|nr:ATP-binding protein [Tolypothrix sp. FACHB-123]MBD2359013.1 response regulator [Tolypothrix sp. FACHB-123]